MGKALKIFHTTLIMHYSCDYMKVVFLGETQKLNMFQAINHGLNITLENNPRSGKDFVVFVFFFNSNVQLYANIIH